MKGLTFRSLSVIAIVALANLANAAQNNKLSTLGGTLVVAVPVQEGLVVCSDKRLYNEATDTYRDDFTKIHKVNNKALFVATHTTGFLNKTNGKMEFDIFDVTTNFVSKNGFTPSREYWNLLKNEIHNQLSGYLSTQRYEDLPETDRANNLLLFNLVFFAVDNGVPKDYSISVFYQKAKIPVIDVADAVAETVRNPKLLGKGKDVMALLAREPSIGSDVSILKFDQSYFRVERTSASDAVNFASRLFTLTNAKLPQARVSAVHDCALLSYENGFQWLGEDRHKIDK